MLYYELMVTHWCVLKMVSYVTISSSYKIYMITLFKIQERCCAKYFRKKSKLFIIPMWPFVTTTLISNVVNTTRFWKKLHQVRSQKWLENQIILSLLEQVNRIKHRANICQTGLKSFSRVSSNIVRIKAFLYSVRTSYCHYNFKITTLV
jgi:hypothetical protein